MVVVVFLSFIDRSKPSGMGDAYKINEAIGCDRFGTMIGMVKHANRSIL